VSTKPHQKVITDYLERVKNAGPEAARAEEFRVLLRELFKEQPRFLRDLASGIERPVEIHEGALVRRGRVDTLCGSLVVEFERSLSKGGQPGDKARGNLTESRTALTSAALTGKIHVRDEVAT
jgi:hypothetical protein